MKTTNVLLAIIAAALVAPQLPALRKAIHNNTVYRVQTALYERAVEEHKEVLKKWCKDSSSRWVQFTSNEKYRRAQYFESTKRPVRSDYKGEWWVDKNYARALDRYNDGAPKAKTYSVAGCIRAHTTIEGWHYRSDYKGQPRLEAKRPEPID